MLNAEVCHILDFQTASIANIYSQPLHTIKQQELSQTIAGGPIWHSQEHCLCFVHLIMIWGEVRESDPRCVGHNHTSYH